MYSPQAGKRESGPLTLSAVPDDLALEAIHFAAELQKSAPPAPGDAALGPTAFCG